MQAALDGIDAHAEHFGGLGCAQALDVAQDQDLTVDRLEPDDRLFDRLRHLLARERFVRPPGRIDNPCGFACRLRVERTLSPVTRPALAPLLEAEAPRNRVEPRRERGCAAELAYAARHGEQRVLENVL